MLVLKIDTSVEGEIAFRQGNGGDAVSVKSTVPVTSHDDPRSTDDQLHARVGEYCVSVGVEPDFVVQITTDEGTVTVCLGD